MNKVVIIDNNSLEREKIKNLMLSSGYIVFSASNGKKGLDLIQDIKPDLVVTEIIMPERDGLEVITTLNKTYPETRIIAISAGGSRLADFPLLDLALQMGADFTFDKPVDEKSFIEVIKRIFSAAF